MPNCKDPIKELERRAKIGIAHKGRKKSPEHKQKIALAHLGKPKPPWTDEHRRNHSIAHKGVCAGSKHPNWQGGKSFEPYCEKFKPEFKERVREFFGRKCVECGILEKDHYRKLDVHHVNYDKMVCCNDTKPLFVCLCLKCHNSTHKNREFWEIKYTKLIMENYDGKCYLEKES